MRSLLFVGLLGLVGLTSIACTAGGGNADDSKDKKSTKSSTKPKSDDDDDDKKKPCKKGVTKPPVFEKIEELEPNNTAAKAQKIAVDSEVSAVIEAYNGNYTYDYFSLVVAKTTKVKLSLASAAEMQLVVSRNNETIATVRTTIAQPSAKSSLTELEPGEYIFVAQRYGSTPGVADADSPYTFSVEDGSASPAPTDEEEEDCEDEDEDEPAKTPTPTVPETPETDVVGSAECSAWCAKLTACGATCDPTYHCRVDVGQCAESTEKFLDCQVDTGSWSCTTGGHSISSQCKRDTTVCKAGTIRK